LACRDTEAIQVQITFDGLEANHNKRRRRSRRAVVGKLRSDDCDEHAIREQGRYWRDNLARMIGHAAGKTQTDRTAFTEAEQFRP
jgi:hypothetical protein